MNDAIRTALSECIKILADRQWHDIYELHEKFHVSPVQIFAVLNILIQLQLIDKAGYSVKLVSELSNKHLSIMNQLRKTERPSRLDYYDSDYLTRRK